MSIKIKQLKNLDLIFLATALLPLSFILGTFVSEFLIFLILFFFFF
mgnify:CR=1 FL=1